MSWLAPDVVPGALLELHRSLTEALGREQFPTEERTFRPHITLARNGTTPAPRGSVAPIAWKVDEMTLVASTTAPGGSRYERIGRWALGGR